MPSHSGHRSDDQFDWFQESLTPYYLKRKPTPMEEMPSVEVDPIEEAEPKKVVTPAEHMTLLQRYVQITEGS